MVIVTEVTASCLVLLKAAEFSGKVRDGWYKGSTEVREFPTKVTILNVKHAQWTSQLERFGMTEDEHFKRLIKEAEEILDEEEVYVCKMRKSRFKRFMRRAFPGKLTVKIDLMMEIVEAGSKQLEEKVKNNDLLERNLEQSASPLPFGPFPKYVPLLDSISDVQNALECVDGSAVVTLHGKPGMGKTSLVKYLALHYEKQKQQMSVESTTPVCFPGGVFYLLCGKEAHASELQMKLLASLGDGLGSSTPLNDPGTSASTHEQEFVHLLSLHKKLALRLANQKSLIILDDVWEVDILEKLLVPSTRAKYLVTSQDRKICSHATMIQMKWPNQKEARKILANYTEGFNEAEFPQSIQGVTDAVIQELGYHPMSLASIATTVNRRRATDPGEWKALKDNLRDLLDDSDFHNTELVYGTRYSHTVGASMMLMVDSLRAEARSLLLLIGLLKGREIPEVLVKFFLNQIQPNGQRIKYGKEIQYLDNKSLVDYHWRDATMLVTHTLRMYYIRKNHNGDMIDIATEIVSGPPVSGPSGSSNNHGGQLVQTDCTYTDQALATIMGAMYIEKPFRGIVGTKLVSQSRIFNSAFIPRSVNYNVDALDLMDRVEDLQRRLKPLVRVLNPDGEGGWKQQAHEYAKKIVIRFCFRNELDDESMAGLIQLPHTAMGACRVLEYIISDHLGDALEDAFLNQNITFSSAYPRTMKSLTDVCNAHDSVAVMKQWNYQTAHDTLGRALHYEGEDTILNIAKKWVEFLAEGSNPALQTAVACAIHWVNLTRLSRASILVGGFPGILDHLLVLIVEGREYHTRSAALTAICTLSRISTIASKIAAMPGALEILFEQFSSKGEYYAGLILQHLSCIPESIVRFTEVPGGLEGLTNMLTSGPKCGNLSVEAAEILANLAATNEVRETILATFPAVKEGLRLLQLSFFSKIGGPNNYSDLDHIETISRVMTILDPLQACPEITSSPFPPPQAHCESCVGQFRAYRQMQMYSEALQMFNIAHAIAHDYYHQIPDYKYKWKNSDWIFSGIFLKAMLEDYAGAMQDINSAVEKHKNNSRRHLEELLGERGVLKRLAEGNLGEALADLDETLKLISRERISQWNAKKRYGYLKHRGLVKLILGDEVGARADAEAALKVKYHWPERTRDALGPTRLRDLQVNYLGFSL